MIKDSDRHLVFHDAFTLGLAISLGLITTATTRSLAIGGLTAVALFLAGIALMRFGPTRRTVNRLALAIKDGIR